MTTQKFTIDATGLLEFELHQTSKEVMDWLDENKNGFYTCLRGPRPSAALISRDFAGSGKRFTDSVGFGKRFIIGTVEPPAGTETCQDAGECMIEDGHCVRNNHAEVNALLRCADLGRSTRHTTVFSINKPCYQCTRALIAAGVRKIYYRYAVYDEDRTRLALEAANVEVAQI